MAVTRIISGGQTGVDRGGLDAAVAMGLESGGWCPKGRRAEDGVIPDRYKLQETGSRQYSERTERNVIESDGTIVIGRGRLGRGSALTARLATIHEKPILCLDLGTKSDMNMMVWTIRIWLAVNEIRVLNVAGSRESKCPGICEATRDLLVAVLDMKDSG